MSDQATLAEKKGTKNGQTRQKAQKKEETESERSSMGAGGEWDGAAGEWEEMEERVTSALRCCCMCAHCLVMGGKE